MVLRWSAAGVLEAERSFRKIVGYRAMPMLAAALRAHDAKIDRASTIDDAGKAA
jgi:putative transposase